MQVEPRKVLKPKFETIQRLWQVATAQTKVNHCEPVIRGWADSQGSGHSKQTLAIRPAPTAELICLQLLENTKVTKRNTICSVLIFDDFVIISNHFLRDSESC